MYPNSSWFLKLQYELRLHFEYCTYFKMNVMMEVNFLTSIKKNSFWKKILPFNILSTKCRHPKALFFSRIHEWNTWIKWCEYTFCNKKLLKGLQYLQYLQRAITGTNKIILCSIFCWSHWSIHPKNLAMLTKSERVLESLKKSKYVPQWNESGTINRDLFIYWRSTMLQKLSKCEVKAAFVWKFSDLPAIQILREIEYRMNTEWFISEQGENPVKTYNTT